MLMCSGDTCTSISAWEKRRSDRAAAMKRDAALVDARTSLGTRRVSQLSACSWRRRGASFALSVRGSISREHVGTHVGVSTSEPTTSDRRSRRRASCDWRAGGARVGIVRPISAKNTRRMKPATVHRAVVVEWRTIPRRRSLSGFKKSRCMSTGGSFDRCVRTS